MDKEIKKREPSAAEKAGWSPKVTSVKCAGAGVFEVPDFSGVKDTQKPELNSFWAKRDTGEPGGVANGFPSKY